MIKARIKGRLGNQLFIYGFARYLCERYGQEALLYDRKDETDYLWHSHLDRFKLHDSVSFTSDKKEIMKMGLKRKSLFLYDRIQCKLENDHRVVYDRQMRNLSKYINNGLLLLGDGVCDLPENIPGDLFFDGYFQSDRYLYPIRDKLIEELVPIDSFNPEEAELVDRIKECESVCVTIRLGDYLGNSTHQVCTKDFYNNAMKLLSEKRPGCKFFIFSDDVAMAKDVFDFDFPVVYDSGKSKDSISLKIMAQCKHFIISNSSFSWWAQYLSEYSDKIVISPTRWFAEDIPCDIMQDSWVRLES